MKVSRLISTALVAVALSVPLALMARADGDSIPASASQDQVRTSRLVYGLLSDSRFVYRPRAMDAEMSSDIFDRYLESLDGNKMFLTAADVERFEPYRARMGAAVRKGELEPAYAIFALYKERVAERVAYSRGLLDEDIFDFTGDDRWHYDREDVDWGTSEELDAVWRQSMRNDWLRLALANREADAIRKTLDRRYQNMGNNVAQLQGEDAFQTFLNAYTASIDPHTDYFNPRNTELFNQKMSVSL